MSVKNDIPNNNSPLEKGDKRGL